MYLFLYELSLFFVSFVVYKAHSFHTVSMTVSTSFLCWVLIHTYFKRNKLYFLYFLEEGNYPKFGPPSWALFICGCLCVILAGALAHNVGVKLSSRWLLWLVLVLQKKYWWCMQVIRFSSTYTTPPPTLTLNGWKCYVKEVDIVYMAWLASLKCFPGDKL